MFKDATLGLVATPFGVASQCVECRANSGDEPIACNGFGPGCLVKPRRIERACRDEETEQIPAKPR
jgi:hypothetical protein